MMEEAESQSRISHAKRLSRRGPQELFERINKYVSKKEPEVEPYFAQKQSKVAICNRLQRANRHRGDLQLQLEKGDKFNCHNVKAVFSLCLFLFWCQRSKRSNEVSSWMAERTKWMYTAIPHQVPDKKPIHLILHLIERWDGNTWRESSKWTRLSVVIVEMRSVLISGSVCNIVILYEMLQEVHCPSRKGSERS